MFATVEFYERENTVSSRVKSIFYKPKIISERVELPENEYFYKLRVPVHKGKIPYDKLKRLSSGVVDGFVFPNGFIPGKEEGIKVYSSKYFKELVLFNTAVKEIEKSVFDPTKTVITLIDKKGVLSSQVSRLVPFACEIRVVTDSVRAYEIMSDKIMSEYGLSLFISDKLSSISKQGIIISCESSVVPLYFKGVVITAEKRFLPFAEVLLGQGVTADKKYAELCPKEIDMTDFLSALCEVCFVSELRNTEHKKLVDIS